jgi:hypothetical protein
MKSAKDKHSLDLNTTEISLLLVNVVNNPNKNLNFPINLVSNGIDTNNDFLPASLYDDDNNTWGGYRQNECR